MLKVLLPIMVPKPMLFPLKTEAMLIENSGIEVPMPTITRPINHVEMLRSLATDVAPLTKIRAPVIKIAKPTRKRKNGKKDSIESIINATRVTQNPRVCLLNIVEFKRLFDRALGSGERGDKPWRDRGGRPRRRRRNSRKLTCRCWCQK